MQVVECISLKSLKSLAVSICVDQFNYPEQFIYMLGIIRQNFNLLLETLSSFGQRIVMETVKKSLTLYHIEVLDV